MLHHYGLIYIILQLREIFDFPLLKVKILFNDTNVLQMEIFVINTLYRFLKGFHVILVIDFTCKQ